MGTVTLKTWRTKLARQLGRDEDSLTPTLTAALNQYVQDAIRDIYVVQRWEFLEAAYRVRLYAGLSGGSVAVTAAGTSWTGTGTTFNTAWTGGIVKIRADDEIYRITTIGSTTALTATDVALRTLTASSYVLYMDEVSLASGLENIESVWVTSEDRRLRPMAPSQMADHKSRGYYAGHPQFYAPKGRDSSGYWNLELYPIPAYDEVLHIGGYKAGTVPTADEGTCDVPDQFQGVVLARAEMKLHSGHHGTAERFPIAREEYGRQQAMMVQQANAHQGPMCLQLDPAVHGMEPMTTDVRSEGV